MPNITIDEARFDFLIYAYFGGSTAFPAVCNRAYRDLCRTLCFRGGTGVEYRDCVAQYLEKAILSMLSKPVASQESYDKWHEAVCTGIVKYYHAKSVEFTHGQAQKWLNMTMKYLYIQGELNVMMIFPFLHIPLDKYVISAAYRQFGLKRPDAVWSKIKNYEEYLNYQKELRSNIVGDPLRWEFDSWLKEAKLEKNLTIV